MLKSSKESVDLCFELAVCVDVSAPFCEYTINDVPRQKVVFVDTERLFLYHLCILSFLMAVMYQTETLSVNNRPHL